MKWILFFFCLITSLQSQELWEETKGDYQVRLIVKQTEITAKELLLVDLEVMGPEGVRVYPEELQKLLITPSPSKKLSAFFLESVDEFSTERGQGFRFSLSPLEAGEIPLYFQSIPLRGEEGALLETFFPDVFEVRVDTGKGDVELPLMTPSLLPVANPPTLALSPENQQRTQGTVEELREELRRQQEQFRERRFPWRWLLGALGIVVVIGGIWKGIQRLLSWRRKEEAMNLDPREEALLALRTLEEKKLPQSGLVEPFYVELTGIVRRYIERVYNVHAPEQTTQEFLEAMRSESVFSQDLQKRFGEFLNTADLVKFARFQATLEECKGAHRAAKGFVAPSEE